MTIQTEHKDRHPSLNRLLAFRRGFKSGAMWSLILAVPVAVKTFVDLFNANSIRYDSATDTTIRISLSWLDLLLCLLPAVAIAITFVTLPCALVMAIVALWRRPKFDDSSA